MPPLKRGSEKNGTGFLGKHKRGGSSGAAAVRESAEPFYVDSSLCISLSYLRGLGTKLRDETDFVLTQGHGPFEALGGKCHGVSKIIIRSGTATSLLKVLTCAAFSRALASNRSAPACLYKSGYF